MKRKNYERTKNMLEHLICLSLIFRLENEKIKNEEEKLWKENYNLKNSGKNKHML